MYLNWNCTKNVQLLHVNNLQLYKKCISIVKIAGERDLFCDSHCPNDIVKRNETHSTQGWIDLTILILFNTVAFFVEPLVTSSHHSVFFQTVLQSRFLMTVTYSI